MCGTNHLDKLPRRDDRVDIVPSILPVEQFHLTLALLRNTRHHGHGINLLRGYPYLFGKISFHCRPKHLLRRLCR